MDAFGQTVEMMLIKYGKGVVDEQFLLNRLANAAMDSYAMVVVLSRASNSLNQGTPTAEYEKTLAQAWCAEVSINEKSVAS